MPYASLSCKEFNGTDLGLSRQVLRHLFRVITALGFFQPVALLVVVKRGFEVLPVFEPGTLTLLAQSTASSLLRHADNVTMSPWGDLIVCEDTANHCGLVGIRPDGQQYALADNAYTNSELAGVCFSPDESVMFVNIQVRGLTLAITGSWSNINS